jgi:hypothetical protein
MKRNPFHQFLNKEDHLQIQVSEWLKYQYPGLIWIHVPNEGKRSPYEQYLFKQLGSESGVSDMIFFKAIGKYHGLVIELKVIYDSGKKNYPTKNQKEFLRAMKEENWYATVAWTFEEATTVIHDYMQNRL